MFGTCATTRAAVKKLLYGRAAPCLQLRSVAAAVGAPRAPGLTIGFCSGLSRHAGQGGAPHSLGEKQICCKAPAARHHFLPPLRRCTEVSAAPGSGSRLPAPRAVRSTVPAALLGTPGGSLRLWGEGRRGDAGLLRGRALLTAAPSSRSPALDDGRPHRGDPAAPGGGRGHQRQAYVADGADGLLHRLERL